MSAAPAFDALDRPPHLLLVDDDDRIRDLLKRFLTQAGARVSAAADAAGARRLLSSMDFDLLILDVMMPIEDGFSLEAGGSHDPGESLRWRGLKQAGSAFVAIDTRFGPVFLALGGTRGAGGTLDLFLGPFW